MRVQARLEPVLLEPDVELSHFLAVIDGEGAVVSFVGVARPSNRDGTKVSGLYLDHYPGMTESSLVEIAAATMRRFEGVSVRVVHRCGFVEAGEPIVFAAAAAPHRRLAFEAAEHLMDHLKTQAAFWKREDRIDGADWIEPTEQDRADAARWSNK